MDDCSLGTLRWRRDIIESPLLDRPHRCWTVEVVVAYLGRTIIGHQSAIFIILRWFRRDLPIAHYFLKALEVELVGLINVVLYHLQFFEVMLIKCPIFLGIR